MNRSSIAGPSWSGPIADEARLAYTPRLPTGRRPGLCDGYRTGGTVNLEHDRSDRAAGRRIAAPVSPCGKSRAALLRRLMSSQSGGHGPATSSGFGFDCGQFLPEERTDRLLKRWLHTSRADPDDPQEGRPSRGRTDHAVRTWNLRVRRPSSERDICGSAWPQSMTRPISGSNCSSRSSRRDQ